MKAELINYSGDDLKRCKCCEESKSVDNFPSRYDNSGRIRPYCKECAKDSQKSRYKAHKRDSYFKLKSSRARSRSQYLKVPFDLDAGYLESIWTGFCPVTGVPLEKNTDRVNETAAELDRLVPEKGYVKGNVAFLSRKINRIKNNSNLIELEKLVEWMKCVLS